MLINSFCIDDDDNVSARVGKGLYLEASAIDHSCWPNAIWVFSGKTLTVRAIDDIESFADVRINYIAVEAAKEQRREMLMKQWYFQCRCPECTFENPGSEDREAFKKAGEPAACLKELEHKFDTHFENEDWQLSFEHGRSLLSAYNFLHPPYSISKACVAMNVGLSAFKVNLLDQARRYMQEAEAQMRVTHGNQHGFYTDLLAPLMNIVMDHHAEQ